MEAKFKFSGVNMSIEVYDDKLEIKPKKGLLGVLTGQGSETILIKNITSVEVRECSLVNGGHLMISAIGTSSNDNKIAFGGFGDRKSMNETANLIKNFLLQKMLESTQTVSKPTSSISEELINLSKLKEVGAINDEEFKQAKNKLLGI